MQRRGARTARWWAAVVAVAAVMLVVTAPGVDAEVAPSAADLQLTGSVEEAPPGGGIDTTSTMRYRVTFANRGPGAIPAGALSVVAFVAGLDGGAVATIDVSRFSSDNLVGDASGTCGVGRRQLVQCTNRQAVPPGQDFALEFENRHPEPVAGQLSFSIEATIGSGTGITDPDLTNNAFRGPGYRFAVQPPTTTTMPTATTVLATSSTDATSSSESSSTTTTAASTTTTTTSTTTTATTATTTATTLSTTTTTLPTTTTAPTTSSEALGDVSVLGATESADGPPPGQAAAETGDDGPPYLLLAGLLATLVLLSGVGLAVYSYATRPPPLVDIRHRSPW